MDLPRLPLRPLLVHLGMPVLPPPHVPELHGGGLVKSEARPVSWGKGGGLMQHPQHPTIPFPRPTDRGMVSESFENTGWSTWPRS